MSPVFLELASFGALNTPLQTVELGLTLVSQGAAAPTQASRMKRAGARLAELGRMLQDETAFRLDRRS